jgi:phasin family protein
MMQSIGDVSAFGKEIMDTGLKSVAAVSKGAQAIAAEATDYSRKSLENGSAALEKLFAARSLDKAVEVQTDFARSAYESFVAEATKLTELYADMARDAFKPFESAMPRAR